MLAALPGAAQTSDGIGVTVDAGNAVFMHRSGIMYPPAARSQNLQGTVVIEVTLDAAGNVADLHVVSGPDELRRAVMQSVLGWHFAHEGAGVKRQISVTFKTPQAAVLGQSIGRPTNSDGSIAAPIGGMVGGGVKGGIVGGVPGGVRATPSMNMPRVKTIEIFGLPDDAKNELMAQLPLHEGDVPTAETLQKMNADIRKFDEHLTMSIMGRSDGTEIRISAPGAVMPRPILSSEPVVRQDAPLPPGRIRQDASQMSARLVSKTAPVYPPLAKQARIQGIVKLQALIGKDGSVQNLTVISGHPLLVLASLDAVRNWVYQPTKLNGDPVEVLTEIDVNFTLSE